MSSSLKKMVFFRVEWLPKYQGERKRKVDYASPYGRDNGSVCEETNFTARKGKYYGFVESGWHKGTKNTIRIEKMGAGSGADKIQNILIVWIATKEGKGAFVVGWYKKATVYRADRTNSNGNPYHAVASVSNSVLIPEKERTFKIKGFGQNYIWYAEKNIKLKEQVLTYIKNYKPVKKLHLSKKRVSKPKDKAEVERAAIDTVINHYKDKGYDVISVEKDNAGWDLEVNGNNQNLKVEVKGLAGSGVVVELTPNEYEKSKNHNREYRICVVKNALSNPFLHIFKSKDGSWYDQDDNELIFQDMTAARGYLG